MYMDQNPNLDPADVESIEVLKEASAAAQYGAQAANGVIVIRTRRGRGDTRVELHSYYGFQKVPKQVPMMNTTQWAALAHQAYANAGWADDSVPSAVVNPPPIATDWQDAVFTTGAIQDHGVSVSGGTANAAYLISGGYVQQDGAIIQTGFQRYNFRVNSQLQRGRVTLGESAALSSTRRQGLNGFPLIDVVRFPPAIPVYDSTTSSGFGFGSDAVPTFGTNPVGELRMQDNWGRSNQAIGTAFAELDLFSGLRYRFNIGANYEHYTQRDFIRQGQLRFRNPLLPAQLWSTQADRTSLLFEHLLTLDRSCGRPSTACWPTARASRTRTCRSSMPASAATWTTRVPGSRTRCARCWCAPTMPTRVATCSRGACGATALRASPRRIATAPSARLQSAG